MIDYNEKMLYTGESKYQKYTSLFWQLLAIIIIIYCCFHFRENPPVISGVILFFLLTLRLSGHGFIIVYTDSIEIGVHNSLLPFFSKKWRFAFEEIISIDSNLEFGIKEQAIADISNSFYGLLTWNTIKLKLTDDREKTISTKVFKSDIIKAFRVVQKASNNKVQFTQMANAPNTSLLP